MAVSTEGEIVQRTVFASELIDSNGEQQMSGALELALEETAGQITTQVILYRAFHGEIHDITPAVTVIVISASPPTFSLVKALNSDFPVRGTTPSIPASTPAHFGFDITVTSPLAKHDAKFHGTFKSQKINKDGTTGDVKEYKWNGEWYAFRSTNLEVIRKGPAEVPEAVNKFLGIKPIEVEGDKVIDVVNTWAQGLLHDGVIQALSPGAKVLFFHDLPPPWDSFLKKDLKASLLPPLLAENSPYRFVSLSAICQDYHQELYRGGMYILLGELKKQDWIKADYAKHIELPPIENICSGESYRNLTRRLYYASYVALRPELGDYFSKAAEYYDEVKKVVLSDQYMEHFLPTLINAVDDTSGTNIGLANRLAILRDKLSLLKEIATNGTNDGRDDILETVTKLATAARDIGLLDKDSMVDLRIADVHLGISPEGFDLALDKFDTSGIIVPAALVFAYFIKGTQRIIENEKLQMFLVEEAQPLGMYTFHGSMDEVVDVVKHVAVPFPVRAIEEGCVIL